MWQKLIRMLTVAGLVWWGSAAVAVAAPSESETALLGTWMGEFSPQPGMPIQRFIMTRNPDGTFLLVSRLYENGKPPAELTNAGLWGVSNGLFFTMVTEVNGVRTNPRSPEILNSYLVLDVKPESFSYQHIVSGNVFRATRVAPGTKLP